MRVFVALVCGILAAGTIRAAEPEGEIAVMSFNIRYNNPNDGPNAWPHRADWVAEIIESNADLVGMQEVEHNQLVDLKRLLPGFAFYGVGREDGEKAGEYVPIAWRKARFTPVEKGSFWLSETPETPSKSWDSSLKRVTTWVRLEEGGSGETLLMVNTHFDHRGEVARRKSAELIRNWIAAHRKGGPVLLTGDFNTLPDSRPYRILTQGEGVAGLADARLAVETPEGPESTWNGFEAIVPGRRIDFIFAAGPIAVKSFRTIDERREGRFPSDHLPIVARVLTGEVGRVKSEG